MTGETSARAQTLSILNQMTTWWQVTPALDKTWLLVGLVGQMLFSMRWIIQWLASEKVRKSVVPATFWYCSLVGGLLVLSYGIWKQDPVIIVGQFGVLVYARNIYMLIRGNRPEQPPAIEAEGHPSKT